MCPGILGKYKNEFLGSSDQKTSLLCKQSFPQQLYFPSCLFFSPAKLSQFSHICTSFIFKKYFFSYLLAFQIIKAEGIFQISFLLLQPILFTFLHFIWALNSNNVPHGVGLYPHKSVCRIRVFK